MMYIFIMIYCIIFDKTLWWRLRPLGGSGNCSNRFPRFVLSALQEKFTQNYCKFIKKYGKLRNFAFQRAVAGKTFELYA